MSGCCTEKHGPVRTRRPAGVSLMETMVVVAVMAMLLLIITQIFALNYRILEQQAARADNETGAIITARTISQAARGAIAVVASYTIGGTLYTSSSTTLVVKMPALSSSGTVIVNAYDYMAFFRDPLKPAYIKVATEADAGSIRRSGSRLMTNYNQTLIFRYDNPDITKANRVSMYLVNSQVKRGQTYTTRAWTAIFLRNFQ